MLHDNRRYFMSAVRSFRSDDFGALHILPFLVRNAVPTRLLMSNIIRVILALMWFQQTSQ